MPTQSANLSWQLASVVRYGTVNVPETDVNGPPSTAYPDQLSLVKCWTAGPGWAVSMSVWEEVAD